MNNENNIYSPNVQPAQPQNIQQPAAPTAQPIIPLPPVGGAYPQYTSTQPVQSAPAVRPTPVQNTAPQQNTASVSSNSNKKGKGGFLKMLCFGLVLTIVCSAASAGVSYLVVDNMLRSAGGSSASISSPSGTGHYIPSVSVTGDPLNAAEVYDLACAQVVGINIPITTTNIFGQTTSSAISGSGFVITEDGYIVTNYHVIEYSVKRGYETNVMFYDGSTYDAKIIGYDEENDLAVIKIDAEDLNYVSVGKSSEMVVGETVYTVGNPLGELAYTMTSGIVSALDRLISTDENTSINMFQIDAAVNSGNSGGPVYNSRGQVIGVVSAKYSSTGVEGLGFAIPIDEAMEIVEQLIEHGYVTGRAAFGVSVQNINPSTAAVHGYPEGVYVTGVNSGSCAEKSGIKVGDIITAIGDSETANIEELTKVLRNEYSAGDKAVVTVFRAGKYLKLDIVFDEFTPN
ncbi:MAG: trypsin-like peptidase domain-containing protein [Clostridia bacterium]|nr:trypsin-like peptidase domain-containing protein [Clostridia bacterium]